MAGIVNDYLIFPILDLIREEIRLAQRGESRNNSGGGGQIFIDPFGGVPSVTLHRQNPDDKAKVILSGATLNYQSGYVVEIQLHQSTGFKLLSIDQTVIDNSGVLVASYHIGLNYDERGLLVSTDVRKTN
jgi:hypothetical protein